MNSPNKTSTYQNISSAFSGWNLSWKGLADNKQGEWFLIGQLALISAHLIPPWPILVADSLMLARLLTISGSSLFILGLVLALRAFIKLGPSLSPLPDPKPGAELIMEGVYKYCRHPLYQAILFCSAGVSISLGSLIHCLLCISLVFLLRSKAKREERKLKKIHLQYSSYLSNTPAIIRGLPFLDWRV